MRRTLRFVVFIIVVHETAPLHSPQAKAMLDFPAHQARRIPSLGP